MKTTEQLHHEEQMEAMRAEFAALWRNELEQSARSLGITPNPACELLLWKTFKAAKEHPQR